jgi:hypothetical protein
MEQYSSTCLYIYTSVDALTLAGFLLALLMLLPRALCHKLSNLVSKYPISPPLIIGPVYAA